MDMNIDFTEKMVVITGGAGGIGGACAKEFLDSGATIALMDLSLESLKKKKKELGDSERILLYESNICDVDNVKQTIRKILDKTDKIDVLVQTAGILKGSCAFDITEQDWQTMMSVNVKGTFFVMQQVVEQSMQHTGGSIINFASMAGIRGMKKGMESAHYSASKGAIVAMSMQAATEWAEYGIRVNTVAPGGVKTAAMTEMKMSNSDLSPIPLRKLSKPSDIAESVLFLASDKASMITGQTLVIDGGSSIVGY